VDWLFQLRSSEFFLWRHCLLGLLTLQPIYATQNTVEIPPLTHHHAYSRMTRRNTQRNRGPRRREPTDLKPSISTASIATVVLIGLAIFTDNRENAPHWALNLGRLHLALLHLPIGFFGVLTILEYLDSSKNGPRIGKACQIVLDFTVIVACISAVLGILLALSGGYDESLLNRHRWLGVLIAIFTFWLVVLRHWARNKSRSGFSIPYHGALVATLILLLVTGNDGITLTHGSGYLSENMEASSNVEDGPLTIDEADIYQDVINPIFAASCYECHGPDKQKGELRLDSYELAMLGGELDDTIVPGDLEASELVYRLHLEIDDDEHMPPEGKPQPTEGQEEILAWWIQTGAPSEGVVAELEMSGEIESAIVAHLNNSGDEDTEFVEEVEIPRAPMKAWEDIQADVNALDQETNIAILRVALDSPAVRVKSPFGDDKIDDDALAKLSPLAENIIELEIGFSDVTNEGLAIVSTMPNLEKLYLQKTGISDDALTHLEGLNHLRYLNLYGTQITDTGLESLVDLPSLDSLFIWETNVTEEAADSFKERKLAQTGIEDWEAEIEALKARIRDATILVDTGVEVQE